MPARITEPAVGASTCASGSQVCTGHIGIFTANEAKNASHAQVCNERGTAVCISVGMSVVPAFQYSAMIASSRNAIMYSRTRTVIDFQLAMMQNGINAVVRITNGSEMPSTPM